jgi:hypothetical protein
MDGTTSMTFAELAKRAGITLGSAKNLVRRKRWTRHLGNDGATRVCVPQDYLTETDVSTSTGLSAGTSPRTDAPGVIASIARLSVHIEHLQRENATLASMPAQVAALRAALEAVRDERNHLMTLLHLREKRSWWRWLTAS